jgi:hypothetical protein
VQCVLAGAGFGFNDPQKQGNGARLANLKEQYFSNWKREVTQAKVKGLELIKTRGFGPKFIRALQSYCFGNKEAFPLDGPAFRCLQEAGIYKDPPIDEARCDIESKLHKQYEVHAIDFHELLRFRGQAGIVDSKSVTQTQEDVITGWNGWRILCSVHRKSFSKEWMFEEVVRNQEIADRLTRYIL